MRGEVEENMSFSAWANRKLIEVNLEYSLEGCCNTKSTASTTSLCKHFSWNKIFVY